MRYLLLAVLLLGCSGKPNAKSCANVDHDARPKVTMTWKIEHGAMDNDPPRSKVTLAVTGAVTANADLGELEGVCKLAEIGAVPDSPANGSKVSEVYCYHAGHGQYATVFFVEPGKLAVRRYDKNEPGPAEESPPMKNVRDIQSLDVPTCVTFASDLVTQGGEL
jgi:hypothetical protein